VEARRRAGAHHQHDPRPAEADGSSDAWTVSFFSASANAHVSVNTFRGGLNCWAQAGSAGRIPDLKPGFVIDGAKLYEIAKQHGDKFLADGLLRADRHRGGALEPPRDLEHPVHQVRRQDRTSTDRRRRQHRQGRAEVLRN
jgi:hypothetical protein